MDEKKLFQLNSEKVLKLQELLNHPVLKEALNIVRQECAPKEPRLVPGIEMRDMIALEGAKSIGADAFYKKLQALTVVNNKVLRDIDKEYIQDARNRLFSTGLYTEEEIKEAERLSFLGTTNQE